jgi:hypothetical protein
MRIALILAACGSQAPPPVASLPPVAAIDAGIDANSFDAAQLNQADFGLGDPGDPTSGVDGNRARGPTPHQVAPHGELDKVAIRNAIKQHMQQIQLCYEKAANVDLSMGIMIQFTIGKDGVVSSSTASLTVGSNQEVANCVAAVIKDIVFPPPKGGSSVNVSYPFNFATAGS